MGRDLRQDPRAVPRRRLRARRDGRHRGDHRAAAQARAAARRRPPERAPRPPNGPVKLLFALLFCCEAMAQVAVPPLKARVTDLTGTLNAQQQQALEHTLAEFEARKGVQIAVLLLPSTQPETIEQFAVRL